MTEESIPVCPGRIRRLFCLKGQEGWGPGGLGTRRAGDQKGWGPGDQQWRGEPGELAGSLPLAPLAPVLGGEVKAFGVDAQVTLLHGSLMALHNVLRESQDVLALGTPAKRTHRQL